MILDAILSGDIKSALISFLLMLPIILLSLSFHEAAHAYVAYKMGDPTARNLGRCTINPVKHLDPIGFIAMLLLGIGWAKPVPIYARKFRDPRKGMAISSLAGPVSNLILALIMAFLCAVSTLFLKINFFNTYGIELSDFIINPNFYPYYFAPWEEINLAITTNISVWMYLELFFYYGVILNVSLAVFNLIPVPPLDGSRLLGLALPPKYYFSYMKYERYIGMAFLALVLILSRFGISIISFVTEPITAGIRWLYSIPADRIFEAICRK